MRNEFEIAARTAKTLALVAVLRDAGATVEVLSDPEVRAKAEAAAGVRPGSERTWAQVEVLMGKPQVTLPAEDLFEGLV